MVRPVGYPLSMARGPHPQDAHLFGPPQAARLREAVAELSWLLGRGYPADSALRLVGDHHQLHRRQRKAVMRCAASQAQVDGRRASLIAVDGVRVAVDGFNAVVITEAALAGGVLLRGADGLWRDMSSVHGSYRRVAQTARALDLLAAALAPASAVVWVLDRPVSNSGRLAGMIRARGFEDVRLEDRADATLAELGWAVATSDGPLLDRCSAGVDLVGPIILGLDGAWELDLGGP